MEMGKRIFELRTAKNLTMEQLAEMLGVQKSAVNKWEKGIVKNIKRPNILKMSEIFDCEPAYLMGFDDLVKDYADKEGIDKVPIVATVMDDPFTEEEKKMMLEWKNADPQTRDQLLTYWKFLKQQEEGK